MKKHVRRWGRGRLPVYVLFLAGFILGAALPNLFWKLEWRQKTMASLYLLETFGRKAQGSPEYFFQVLRMRGSLFLLFALCGITVFGVPLAVLGVLGSGMIPGMILAMSVLQFGISGGAVGLGLLFPQYVFYLPVICMLLMMVYGQSLEIWRGHGLLPRKMYRYGMRVLLLGLIWLGGVLSEVYLNPLVTEFLFGKLKLF